MDSRKDRADSVKDGIPEVPRACFMTENILPMRKM